MVAIIGILAGTAGRYQDMQSQTRITKVPPAGNREAVKQQLKADYRETRRRLGLSIVLEIGAMTGCIGGAAAGTLSLAYRGCGAAALLAAVVVGEIWKISDMNYQLGKLRD